jgi:hypothetical protein
VIRPGGAPRSSSDIVAQPLKERMPDFAFRRLRPVFDLGEEFWFDPDALVRDPFRVRLRLADQWLEAMANKAKRTKTLKSSVASWQPPFGTIAR